MLLKRYHISAGATTTAGGVVRASSKGMIPNGAAVALEGKPVDCPACGAQGAIQCVMPRLADRFGDRQYALSDDLCICGCNPPPKLIAEQTFKYQAFLFVDENPARNVAKAAALQAESGKRQARRSASASLHDPGDAEAGQ